MAAIGGSAHIVAHRGVGVPGFADIRRVARFAPHHHHFRIFGHAVEVRMDEDLAEAAGEGLVPGDVECLVTEEDDAVLVQRIADLSHGLGVEIARDVDAVDLSAAGTGDRPHFDAAVSHGFLVIPRGCRWRRSRPSSVPVRP
jgi:hypothetical protein